MKSPFRILFILLLASVTWGQECVVQQNNVCVIRATECADWGGSIDSHGKLTTSYCLPVLPLLTRHTHPPLPEPEFTKPDWYKYSYALKNYREYKDSPESLVLSDLGPPVMCTSTLCGLTEPIDVPAIQVQTLVHHKGDRCLHSGFLDCFYANDEYEPRPKCQDSSRIKLQSEDGKWWCHKVQQ